GSGRIRLLATLMITLNMRGVITCVGPLLRDIQSHFGLSGTAAGLLTSLPLFAFGFLSPYAGTVFIGCGIAFNNVLLPGLLRRDFPAQLTLVTALFTMVLVTCGGLGSGIAIPLADWGGWRFSLVAWAIPAVVGLAIWAPHRRERGTFRRNPVHLPDLRARLGDGDAGVHPSHEGPAPHRCGHEPADTGR